MRAPRPRPRLSATRSSLSAARPTASSCRRPRSTTATNGPRPRTSPRRASTSAPPPTVATCTPSAGASCRPTRTPRRSSATTRRATSGPSSSPCPRRSAASASGTPAAASSRSAARMRISPSTTCRATTSGADSGDELPALPTPRHGVAVTALGDSLYAIGGATLAGHVAPTNDVEVLDLSGRATAPVPKNDEWRGADDPPSAVQYAATAEVGDRIWLIGGLGEDGTATAESLAYDRPITRLDEGDSVARADPPRRRRGLQGRAGGHRRRVRKAAGLHRFLTASTSCATVSGCRWGASTTRAGRRPPQSSKTRSSWWADGTAERLVPETEVYDDGQWTVSEEDPDATRTPRRSVRRRLRVRGWRPPAVRGRERPRARALQPCDEHVDQARPDAKEHRLRGRDVRGRSHCRGRRRDQFYDRLQRRSGVRCQPGSSGRRFPSSPRRVTASRVAALGRSLFAIGGAAVPGHFQSTRDANVLEFE